MADQTHVFMLDVLLDTRLAVLAEIDPALADKIANDPETRELYNTRPNDLFKEFNVDSDKFNEAYAKRDANTLTRSLPTNFLFEMKTIGSGLVNLKAQEPHNVENLNFIINTYPYKDLTRQEVDRILDAINARLQTIINLSSTYRAPEAMSPTTIRGLKWNAIYFYDNRDWLMAHYHKDKVTEETIGIMPGVTIYTAPLFDDLDQLKEAVEYQNPQGITTNPIIGMQVMWSPFFRLEPVPLREYSLVSKERIAAEYSK